MTPAGRFRASEPARYFARLRAEAAAPPCGDNLCWKAVPLWGVCVRPAGHPEPCGGA